MWDSLTLYVSGFLLLLIVMSASVAHATHYYRGHKHGALPVRVWAGQANDVWSDAALRGLLKHASEDLAYSNWTTLSDMNLDYRGTLLAPGNGDPHSLSWIVTHDHAGAPCHYDCAPNDSKIAVNRQKISCHNGDTPNKDTYLPCASSHAVIQFSHIFVDPTESFHKSVSLPVPSTKYDLFSVIEHELGHYALGDLAETSAYCPQPTSSAARSTMCGLPKGMSWMRDPIAEDANSVNVGY